MAEIRIVYKRTWQPKPYESEGLELSITETVDTTPLGTDARAADDRGELLARLESLIYKQLAAVGERAMLDRLGPEEPTPPRRPGHPGGRR